MEACALQRSAELVFDDFRACERTAVAAARTVLDVADAPFHQASGGIELASCFTEALDGVDEVTGRAAAHIGHIASLRSSARFRFG